MPLAPRRLVSLLAVIVTVASCGGGDSAAPATSSTTTVPVATTTPATVPPTSTTIDLGDCDGSGSLSGSVSTVGIGSITFGMTVVQAQDAAGVCLPSVGPVDDCYAVIPAGGPDGLAFVVEEGTIERVDITAGTVATRSGVGIGTAADRVRELFGAQLEERAHPTKLGATELVFVPRDETDAAFRVVFETDGQAVTTLRAGRLPLITNPVACP